MSQNTKIIDKACRLLLLDAYLMKFNTAVMPNAGKMTLCKFGYDGENVQLE
jgi:hypothetical protein